MLNAVSFYDKYFNLGVLRFFNIFQFVGGTGEGVSDARIHFLGVSLANVSPSLNTFYNID